MWSMGAIQEIATWMLLRFGEMALIEARERAARFRAIGDTAAVADWQAVEDEIKRLIQIRPPNGGATGH